MTDALSQWLKTTPLSALGELLALGGPVMIVLGLIAFIATAAALYALIISIIGSPRRSKRLDKAFADWKKGNVRRANDVLENDRNPLSRLLGYTLGQRWAKAEDKALREEVGRRASRLFTPFDPPLKLLEVTAALAPLLGLLGTVTGMMAAFSAMATAQGGADPTQLSGGIYEALTTTAAGLVIAIPAAAAAAWLDYRLRRQQQIVNDLLSQALNSHPPVTLAAESRLEQAASSRHEVRETSHATG